MSLFVIIMAEPVVPVVATILQTNILSWMPSLHSKNSLCFQGKDIEGFLTEYEHFASHVNLTDEAKCKEIWIYFTKKEKWVLDILKGYAMLNWNNLKGQLWSLYMSSVERRIYQPWDIQCFITKKRKILKLIHFNMYWHQFLVITAGLQALSAYNCNDCFWSGIRPTSLRDVLENELRTHDYWTDLTLPLPIDQVIEVAVKFLNRAIYHPRDVSLHLKWKSSKKKRCNSSLSESESSDNGASNLSASSSEDKLLSDEDEDEPDEKKKSTKKKSWVEKCEKSTRNWRMKRSLHQNQLWLWILKT